MKKSIKLIALAMAVMMLAFALAACGSSSSGGAAAEDPNLGVYKLSKVMGLSLEEYAKMMEITEEEAADSMTLELKADGKAEMIANGEATSLEWSLDGQTLTLTDGKDPVEATLVDGVITLADEGIEIVFAK